MPSLKDLRNRIESVKNTRKITKAMQMVAAAKLRRAQEAAESARPYAKHFNATVGALAALVQDRDAGGDAALRLLRGTGRDASFLLVVITAERGLCGSFNSSIVKLARQQAQELVEADKTVKILTVGKKGREQLRREFGDMFVGHIDLGGAKNVGYSQAQNIAREILSRFEGGEFDKALLFYSRFQSVISQIPTQQQIIPALYDTAAPGAADDPTPCEYEPEEAMILAELLPRGVVVWIFSALLENAASEQGARMSAMDNATRNAGEMIDTLTIQFNRSRQAVITNELIEIISGAEAL